MHNLYLGDLKNEYMGESMTPQTAQLLSNNNNNNYNNTFSPGKVNSQLSISQLTNMSNEGCYIRNPVLGGHTTTTNTFGHSSHQNNGGNSTNEPNRAQNLSPGTTSWQPNMVTIAEGSNKK